MLKDEEAIVYVTKYALTSGIIKTNARICHPIDSDMISFEPYRYAHKGEWFRDKISALKKAEEMRQKKIKSIRKQIEKLEKLENMTFEIKGE